MPIFATAGAKLYIGGPLNGPAVTEASFSGQTGLWKEVKSLETIGSVGDVSEEVTSNLIGESRTIKMKGTRNAGTMEVVAAIDYSDEGQLAVLAAEATPNNYAFRLVFNDAPVGGTPSQRLFVALVISVQEQLDDANSVMKLNLSLGVNSNVVRVLAAEDD